MNQGVTSMSTREETRRIAEVHAEFFDGPTDANRDRWLAEHHDLEAWVAEHWSPDMQIFTKGVTPVPFERWVSVHSGQQGYDWENTDSSVTKLVVGDDSFVIEQVFTRSESSEQGGVPVCLVFTVANGKAIRLDQYWSLAPRRATEPTS